MDESKKYKVIKALADHPNGSKDRAALTLGCTKRHINRMLAGYRKEGKAFFLHGNRGRKPPTSIPEVIRSAVVDLYRTKYYEANFQHYSELLAEREDIHISVSSVSKILEAEYILSPKVTKDKRKRMEKELLAKKELASSKKRRRLYPGQSCGHRGCSFQTPKMYLFRRNAADGRCFLRMGAWTDLALTSRC